MPQTPLAVLISGGLDSAILLGAGKRIDRQLFADCIPLYIRCGLTWEEVELEHLRRFLEAIASPGVRPLTILDQPVADLYGAHWSITGRGVPAASDPDETVFLPGRNVLLLSKALLWCHLHGAFGVALGSLASNPFPDASLDFFRAMEDVVNRAVGCEIRILLPFASMTKRAVLLLGGDLPLDLTFSCIQPVRGLHCGRCNKCAERIAAFKDAGMRDPTPYA